MLYCNTVRDTLNAKQVTIEQYGGIKSKIGYKIKNRLKSKIKTRLKVIDYVYGMMYKEADGMLQGKQ